LSPVTIATSNPAAAAFIASVPITSSASNPSAVKIGTPIASQASCTQAICSRRSSGIAERLAL
jgi:hypothetical protein